jgi:hypothetical protein
MNNGRFQQHIWHERERLVINSALAHPAALTNRWKDASAGVG